MSKISVVINTLNEEKNLPRALASVKKFADEIVVVDMHSTDKTRVIAKKAGAKVYKHKRTGYVEPARNWAIGKATGDWVLVLDADEEISGELAKVIVEIVDKPKADYFRLPRKNIIFGKWIEHSRWWPDYNIRFFRRGKVEWSEIIHSVPVTVGKGADLEAKERNAIIHHHYENLEQYITRMNSYTSRHAELLVKEGYKFTWRDLIRKPANEFLSRYFFGEAYKDGLHGLVLALLQGVSELVLYLKTWQIARFPEQRVGVREVIGDLKEAEKDFSYWEADALIRDGAGFGQRVKRKFKLR